MDSISVSLVAAVLGLLGLVVVQILSSRSASRIAEATRQAQSEENAKQRDADRDERAKQRQADREDQHRRNRQDAYSRFVSAARAFQTVFRPPVTADDGDAALDSLRDAAAVVELNAPELADGPLVEVLGVAERLHGLVVEGMATAAVIDEAAAEFERVLRDIRGRMWSDIGTGTQ